MELVVQSGAEPGRTYDLSVGSKLSIGRQSSNEIVVSDEQVSRKHAHIELKSAGVIVTDLSSSNGTFVNGTRISSVITLKPGDTLQVGTTVLKLVDTQDGAATMVSPNLGPSAATLPAFELGSSPYGSGIDSGKPASSSMGTGAKGSYDAPPLSPPSSYGEAALPPIQPNFDQFQPPSDYGQSSPPPSTYGQPQPEASYPQYGGFNQPPQGSNSYPQPSYGQPPQGSNSYPQPNYGQPPPVGSYPQQAAYAQPPKVGRKGSPLLIIAVIALAALVLLGGGFFFLLGSGGDLPAPNNSTKVELNSADQTELAKTLKDTTYSFYTSKESISSLKSFYTDKMKGKGYTLDNRSSSTSTTEQLVFTKGDKAALVLIIQLDSTNINQLETSATSFKGKLKDGETLVGLAEGKASTITT
ncbi:MAG: FHA domain-containing protein [Chloroflexota bacterium]